MNWKEWTIVLSVKNLDDILFWPPPVLSELGLFNQIGCGAVPGGRRDAKP